MRKENDEAKAGLVTGRKAGLPRISGSNLETEEFPISPQRSYCIWGVCNGYWGKASGGVKLITHQHLLPKLSTHCPMPPLLILLHGVDTDAFVSIYTISRGKKENGRK